MSKRWRLSVALLLSSVLLAGIACTPFAAGSGQFQTASFFPKNTYAYTAFTLRPSMSQVANLAILADAFKAQPGFDDAWTGLKQTSLSTAFPKGDFEKDILPLIDGEIAFGVYPGTSASTIALIHSSDPEKLVSAVFNAVGGTATLTSEKGYKGATYFTSSDAPSGLVLAAHKGWVIGAESRALLEETVDRIDGARGSLAENTAYQNVMARLTGDRLGQSFFDTAPILDLIAASSPTQDTEVLQEAEGQIGVAYAATPAGLDVRMEQNLVRVKDYSDFAKGSGLQPLDRLPADTLFAFSGESLSVLLSQTTSPFATPIFKSMPGAGTVGRLAAPVTAALSSTRHLLQVEGEEDAPAEPVGDSETVDESEPTSDSEQTAQQLQELYDHFKTAFAAEFVVGAGPDLIRSFAAQPEGGAGGAPQPAGVFAGARITDADAAAGLLDSEEMAAAAAETVDVDGYSFKRIPFSSNGDEPSPGGAYVGFVKDWAYATLGDPTGFVRVTPETGLSSNAHFQAVKSALVVPGFNSFVDIQATREVAEQTFARELADPSYQNLARPILMALKALGTSSQYTPYGSTSHTVLTIGK